MTLVVTAEEIYDEDVPPAIILTVTSSTSGPNPVPVNSPLAIWRVHEDGSEHLVITTEPPRLIPNTWIGLDYHCPYNVPVTYRVEAAGVTATVDVNELACVYTWLISPSEPALSVRVDAVKAMSDRGQGSRAGRYAPYGGKATFHSEGERDGLTGSITVQVPDDKAIKKLLKQDSVILINTPGPGFRIEWLWVQPFQLGYVNPGYAYWPYELVVIPFEESADPEVDQTPIWTIDIAAAQFAAAGVTVDTLGGLYATVLDLAINRRSA